ncbi:hypothetical protein ACHAO8_003410 [Botrytis cinerea]
MPGALTHGLALLVAVIYACFISVVLMPIFLLFNAIPTLPNQLYEAFRGSQTINRLRDNGVPNLGTVIENRRRRLAERPQLPEDSPGARDTPDDELPQARREWRVSRHEIMMGREYQIAQYRGFLHEFQERNANRALHPGQLAALPEIDDALPELDDASSSDDEFDIYDWEMSLP